MQFFLITPPLLYLYVVVSPILGWIITGMMSIGSVIAAAITVHHYDLSTEVLSPKNGPEYFKEYYYMPYIRVGAYIIGIWTGWILLAHRNK